ncbi:hypoxanthine phosphoribosyltransferase [Pontiella agarivorans]|uniref:Hypoxanthine phosphoribosyltransferase n=1 Tax=Pontiella agarivorans TaxID=3038953 RepID=A0ABU5MZJ0_9BACT|nr:hypoxanthine phosphoribosyltransferase [Pontiella agarivorans]MDZ8119593.1 hypoxanthine phosphoribosyltransferase [Pontiella agarivorans]
MREHDVKEILIDKKAIAERVDALVDEIVAAGQPDRLVVIGILKGSFMFFADLMRSFYRHNAHPHIDFMTLSSYGAGTVSSGTVEIIHDIRENLTDATVLLVDDILDSGRTLAFTKKLMLERGAKSVYSCVLLDKITNRAVEFEADYAGFQIDDLFVVGYGLDYDNKYRELPHIARVNFH